MYIHSLFDLLILSAKKRCVIENIIIFRLYIYIYFFVNIERSVSNKRIDIYRKIINMNKCL